jgi:hypothetical protein
LLYTFVVHKGKNNRPLVCLFRGKESAPPPFPAVTFQRRPLTVPIGGGDPPNVGCPGLLRPFMLKGARDLSGAPKVLDDAISRKSRTPFSLQIY